MTALPGGPLPVPLADLRVGDLLAEGGEGQVFELPLQPHLVFKSYRHPVPRPFLDDLVRWPGGVADPGLAARVGAAAAWPEAVVVDGPGPAAQPAGVLVPRAPRRFAVRHRDGTTRLATLSYLTADPAHRQVAYGLSLPPAVSAERLGIVYALARLLEAFESAAPRVGHGDLSTKNVLWSLQRGPEVFVLDCDNCETYGAGGEPLGGSGRRRPMTPNWDDPAVAGGRNPSLESDRYSLALIFLRVVGAANFPIQARQRQGGSITVDFAMPAGYLGEVLLGPGALLWELCARGLDVSTPGDRPSASTWVGALEAVLDGLGAAAVMRAVWGAQGGGPARSGGPPTDPRPEPATVAIRPVVARPRPDPRWTTVAADPPPAVPHARPVPAGATGSAFVATSVAPAPVAAQVARQVRQAVQWWMAAHRRALRSAGRGGGGRRAVRQLAWCVAIDVGVALAGLFVVAMAVAPVLGL